ncbi:amidohydrolase [Thiolapillus sp.]
MKIFAITIALVFAFTANATAQEDKLDALIKEDQNHLIEIFKDIHKNPELAFMETRTSGIVAKELKKLGYKVITGIAKTGVVGILENGKGPVVMFRADMDANAVKEVTGLDYASTKTVTRENGKSTPVMHACGHDAHTTWLIGIARAMKELKDSWKGTLILVAQPAEETIEGARAMVDDGMYEKGVPKPDYLFAMHTTPLPTGTVNLEKGPHMAGTDQIDVTFKGIGGHGAMPHLTKDPILMAAAAIVDYQFIVSRAIDPQNAAVLTVGAVRAGSDNNVIPSEALLKINLRWFNESDRKLMVNGIKRINKSIAMAYGLPEKMYPTMKFKGWSFPVENDSELVDKITPVVIKTLGEKSILSGTPPNMGSEDFHHLVIKNPKHKYVFMHVGTAKPSDFAAAQKEGKLVPYANHNPDYKVDLDAIPLGVKLGTNVLLELFRQ